MTESSLKAGSSTWWPLLGVGGVLLIVTWGGYALADVTEAAPMTIAPGVEIQLAEGWELSSSTEDPPGAVLVAGSGYLYVAVVESQQFGLELLSSYVEGPLGEGATSFAVSPPTELPPWGESVSAVRASYTGRWEGLWFPIEGEVTVVSYQGLSVLYDGWADQGQYDIVRNDIDAMMTAAAVP